MGEHGRPIANPAAVLREEFDDWAVLFNPDTTDALGVDPVGVAIWKLLDGQHNAEEVAAQLASQFDGTPSTMVDDVQRFVDQLAELGFVGYQPRDSGAQAA